MSDLDEIRSYLDFQPVQCPGCGAAQERVLATVDRHRLGLRLVVCPACGLGFYNPMPTPAGLDRFYAQDYRSLYRNKAGISGKDAAAFGIAERMNYSAAYLAGRLDLGALEAVLDVGAGDGSFMKALAAAGAGNLHGVEPSAEYRAYAQQNSGAQMYPTLDSVPGSLGAGLVIVNHVLEHVAQPQSFLRQIGGLMRPGGMIYIDVPDIFAYTSIDDIHLAHVLHFSQAALENMVGSAGFSVQEVEAHVPPHHPRSLRCLARFNGEQVVRCNPLGADELQALEQRFQNIASRERSYRAKQLLGRYISFGKLRRLFRKISAVGGDR